MDVFRLIGVSMVICFACITLRGRNPEFALLVSLAGGVLVLSVIFVQMKEILAYFDDLIMHLHVPSEGVFILIKCLGLSYVAKIACDTCMDCGETSTATKIEFAAKVGMLILSLPLFDQLIAITTEFSG